MNENHREERWKYFLKNQNFMSLIHKIAFLKKILSDQWFKSYQVMSELKFIVGWYHRI